MKKVLFFLAVLLSYTGIAQSDSATSMNHNHSFINNKDLKWMDGPPGLPKGAKLAVLHGDPSKEGLFTIRLSFPAGFKIPAHWHPTTEHVTIIDGTLYMGMGEKLDESKVTAMTPGGYASMPAKTGHYVFTKEPTTVQVYAIGPFAITYYNPADDPRTK